MWSARACGDHLDVNLARSEAPPNLRGPTAEVTVPVWDQNQAQIAKARIVVALQEKAYQELLETVAQEVRKASAGRPGQRPHRPFLQPRVQVAGSADTHLNSP